MRRAQIISAATVCIALVLGATSAACSRPAPGDTVGRVIIHDKGVDINTPYVEGTPDDAAIPGIYPVHYRSTNLPGEGQTIVISGHHFTHAAPGVAGGAFLHLDKVVTGDSIEMTRAARFGGGTYHYIVSSNRTVDCGRTSVGFYYCPAALKLLRNFKQTKVYLITCIGDGYQRRIVTAFAVGPRKKL